tara:strand:- start:61 stop:234 length:174 start_codon:yes stop_codon:yes gene_type:complete
MSNTRTGPDYLNQKPKKKKRNGEFDPSLEEVASAFNRKRKDRYEFKSRSKIKNLKHG